MRIWSVHPKHLDSKGLVALWRESLLAKNVLVGKTKGYKSHPQLERFWETNQPMDAINYYLHQLWIESTIRNYNFDKSKFTPVESFDKIPVTTGQLNFERNHLLEKLKKRDQKKHNEISKVIDFEIHPLFILIEGEIESWEKI